MIVQFILIDCDTLKEVEIELIYLKQTDEYSYRYLNDSINEKI